MFRRKAGEILPEAGCPAGAAVWFLYGIWAASGEGAARKDMQ
ncbi:hypothetical protein DWUX_1902 [Desulfovibrio diazotrophicus]|nr:hypothetical protein DWUX_1902 [Desulfovibrio diazotrophicus]